jgi:hypothetical protein
VLRIRNGQKIRIRDEQPDHISDSLEGLKYFNSLLQIWDEKNSNPGSGMEKIRIRDPGWKKFGSGINIPDPQHCIL